MSEWDISKNEGLVAELTSLLESSPDDSRALVERGNVLFRLMKYDSALADYDRAAELMPESPIPHNNIGTVFAYCNDYEKAIEAFSVSLRLKATAEVLVKRAMSYGRLMRNQEAINDAIQAMRMDSADPEVSRACGLYHQFDGNFEVALKYYDKFLAAAKDDYVVLYHVAQCQSELGMIDEAVQTMRKYIDGSNPMDSAWIRKAEDKIKEFQAK